MPRPERTAPTRSPGPGGDDGRPATTLVDHHCHAIATGDLDRPAFELLLTEGAHPAAPGTSHFDTPLGLAIRRWCPPVLDGEPGMSAVDYLDRRRELGAADVNRRMLRAAGVDALLVDTGHAPPDGTSVAELADLADAATFEVVRIEQVAEDVLATLTRPRDFTGVLEERLRARAAQAVGLKSIVAYRGGLRLAPTPGRRQVEAAVEQVLARDATAVRLQDPALLRHGLEVAADVARDLGLPVQFHTGFGDVDLQLDRSDPTLLTPLLGDYGQRGVAVVLLHCYPYQREAGYLASVFPHVHLDVGLAVPHLGASSHRVLAEALELAPFGSHLFSSDAYGLAELFLVASTLFRRSLHRVLDDWVGAGDCSASDADRIAAGILAGNARRIYPLDR